MSEEHRRPPPGRSFPFLRKGQGLKAKINYPVLSRGRPSAATNELDILDDRASSEDRQDYYSEHHRNTHWDDIDPRTDLAMQSPSARRTVDSGFDQVGHLQNERLSTSSPDDSSSPHSSSINSRNVNLRKEDVRRVQQLVRGQDYSFPDQVIEPSPMLASTPHPDQIPESPQGLPLALETSILGDTTNMLQRTDDSPQGTEENYNDDRSAEIRRSDAAVRQPAKSLRGKQIPHIGRHPDVIESSNVQPQQTEQTPYVPSGISRGLRSNGSRYKDVERKLIGQLRDVIAHLDLADIKQQIRAKELEDAYLRFQQDVRDFEAEKEAEKERVQRIRRQLERERKIASKDGAEKEKAIAEQVEDLTKTIAQKDRQLSTLRVRLRKAEEQVEAKYKELKESNQKTVRLEKTCKILQRQMAQLRGNYAKQSQELAAEIQASRTRNVRRTGSIGLLPSLRKDARKERSATEDVEIDAGPQRALPDRSKCVSWADKPIEDFAQRTRATTRKGTYEMELVEEGTALFGPCRLFKNGLGDWTKVTTTECGCDLHEYSNTDVRWISCDRSIEIYYYGIAGVTIISLANGRNIRYFNDGQIEIYRLSGEISRFDAATSQRCETMLDENGLRFVEIFDCTGYCILMEGDSRSLLRFGERSSYRGNPPDRHVYNHSNVEPEWIEPDFSARRCPDGSLKIKFANIMVCCLGLEDVGYVKHTTRLEDGVERKKMCVEWGHVARAKQRQIESQKCQQLTAFNATM
ncbi:unnamed protein product [Cylicocyclus nassatus]|uniref:Uncharacterized protein n=1 Tax=Cylicocyclus nassatus TaxID=53992 RepID=A0AA36GWM2_CYLNA|nr:unnamed protein product [Cylicocyclus nassatus]